MFMSHLHRSTGGYYLSPLGGDDAALLPCPQQRGSALLPGDSCRQFRPGDNSRGVEPDPAHMLIDEGETVEQHRIIEAQYLPPFGLQVAGPAAGKVRVLQLLPRSTQWRVGRGSTIQGLSTRQGSGLYRIPKGISI